MIYDGGEKGGWIKWGPGEVGEGEDDVGTGLARSLMWHLRLYLAIG